MEGMQSVRPRRRPQYLEDYEVDLAGFRGTPHPTLMQSTPDNLVAHQRSVPAPTPGPGSSQLRWNTIDEWHPSHSHLGHQAESDSDSCSEYPASRATSRAMHHAKMAEMRRESTKLYETQCAIRADIARLDAAKEELAVLLQKASLVSTHNSPATLPPTQPLVEDWPDPPPWIPFDAEALTSGAADPFEFPPPRVIQTASTPKVAYSDGHPRHRDNPMTSIPHSVGGAPSHHLSGAPPRDVDPVQHNYRFSAPTAAHISGAERYYRGPQPTIPYFRSRDPSEFAHLKMALDNLLPPDSTELFKYQVLVDHLKLEEACLIADSYLHSPTPYTDTMSALHEKFGQPHQIALQRIAHIMDLPDVPDGHSSSFEKFSLQVQSLVGMLKTLGSEGAVELQCGSHVARLLKKLSSNKRADFRRYRLYRPDTPHTLAGLAEWLKQESWCENCDYEPSKEDKRTRTDVRVSCRPKRAVAAVLMGVQDKGEGSNNPTYTSSKDQFKPYCFYCQSQEHPFSQCPVLQTLSRDQVSEWIRKARRCWRCGKLHQAAQCNLKKSCPLCKRKHLRILHDVNDRPPRDPLKTESYLMNTPAQMFYLNRPTSTRVLLKVVRVLLHNGNCTLNTFAILDDGSERTMLLPEAVHRLGLRGNPESLALRTIRYDTQTLHGASVSFQISSPSQPHRRHQISKAFTAPQLALMDHSYPVSKLQAQYRHLTGLPLQSFERAKPLILIGADHPHLITPIGPVKLGPPGGPAAVHTRLGWTLQGPARLVEGRLHPQQCLHTSVATTDSELFQAVEKLWRIDTIPFQSEQVCTRSKQDKEAMALLESKTVIKEVNGVRRYATPLLRKGKMPLLRSSVAAVLPRLRSTERKLAREPQCAAAYCLEIQKLVLSGSVEKLEQEPSDEECWFIPHHMVMHNDKRRVVFDCSFQLGGVSLNESLYPGPALSPSLLGVLLRFREHAVAISGDVRAMFHQVHLLPEDYPLLRFIWRDMRREDPPEVYEWRVLPFGTACSPCCAIYALQRHVKENSQPGEDVRVSVERSFYVDNCLQSLPDPEKARQLIDKLRALLASGGFELRQWASSVPAIINHLPPEARSESSELWLSQEKTEGGEGALGLSWNCPSDVLRYKCRKLSHGPPTMRIIYKVLASQYDPFGFILPFVTRAKILVQRLWEKRRGWDDPLLPGDLSQSWNKWEEELSFLPTIHLPRPYVPPQVDQSEARRELIFSDASESAYGAVAYLRTVEKTGTTHLSFVMARSRVAPRRRLSVPRLELCAAVSGAQLARLLQKELTLEVHQRVFWSDSTTVLSWIRSESCRYKIFVGTRIAEIHELTEVADWRYVDSGSNPADDLTRGKALMDLSESNRWTHGPPFLLQKSECWPVDPNPMPDMDTSEIRRSVFCGALATEKLSFQQYKSWEALMEGVAQELHGAAGEALTADDFKKAQAFVLQQTQQECFQEELTHMKANKPLSSDSRLLTLAPEFDEVSGLIRVGGRLRRSEELDVATVHPVVLDSKHPAVKLLIQDYDQRLNHPGSERVFAEMRRRFWILRGREAIRRVQHACPDCRRWRARPVIPRMADLPESRLRLFQPAFHSTGMDCFGPFQVKVGQRLEKRWGILFKCLTTKALHIELLHSLDADSFLLSLRRFIARRGTPKELRSDRGTNFKGGEREIKEAFEAMSPELQRLLAKQQIAFIYNPPAAPHFGGVWEREVRSIKEALYKTVGAQSVQEEVLGTVLVEVEGILNSRPLGYVSSDLADADPVTPNFLLTGRLDSALPQVIYPVEARLSRRRWRHAQLLTDHFWSAFIRHYLPSLQGRAKWFKTLPGISVGAVVLTVDPQQPRAQWPVGTVVQVHPSKDGQVRSVDVRIQGKIYTRPVARLIELPKVADQDYPTAPSQPS